MKPPRLVTPPGPGVPAGSYVYRVQREDAQGGTSNVAEARVHVDPPVPAATCLRDSGRRHGARATTERPAASRGGAVVTSTGRLLMLAACVGALLATPVPGAAAEIMIESGALTPALLTIESDDSVTFVNRSGRVVHLDFLGPADEHQVFQVPGRIRATFHRAGRHPYVVHFETAPRAELRGFVEVREPEWPRSQPPVCSGVSVGDICLER
ncbi:MAG TPA: hypothetical protein VFP83_04465 [Candidatus Limnocylindria bacterium]|nr:hypothetical protein [Candidatus Limnocylindria bacterium]